MRRRLLTIFSILFLIFYHTSNVQAADCSKACIDLTVSDGELVITGKRLVPKPKYSPKPSYSAKPIQTQSPKATPHPIRKYRKAMISPRHKSPIAKSLNDQIRQLLPTSSINYQPQSGALLREPVIFWSKTPLRFIKTLYLLDVKIDLDLTPKFRWSWGDGAILESLQIGAPFPSREITHTYLAAGWKDLLLITSWSGRYRLDGGGWQEIPGVIITKNSSRIEIMRARSVFTG